MTDLSAHFTLEELTRSPYAERWGIDNTPPAEVLGNLDLLAAGLERVRSVLSMPIHVDSGYRCPKLNSAIKGAKDSAHTQGLAADIVCPDFGTPLVIAQALIEQKQLVGFDTVIQEGTWLHVAFADEPRFRVLTAHFGNGATTYTEGLA